MIKTLGVISAAMLICAGPSYAQLPPPVATRPPVEAPRPIRKPQMHFGSAAVVELFCSTAVPDCIDLSPAIRRIQDDFERQNAKADIVVFHVTSMDTPNGRDQYADQLSDRKQRDYAEFLRAKRMHVPQLFVNGAKTPVLLNGASIQAGAVHALTIPSIRKVSLAVEALGETDAFRIHYKVEGMPLVGKNPLEFLHLVQVQRRAEIKARRPGKAEQLTVRLTNIARSLDSVRLEGNVEDVADVIVPEGLTANDMSVIAYVQDARTRKVLGSARVDLATGGSSR